MAVWAIKEWAIAVDALLTGDLLLLVRKGGIREANPYFEVPSDRPILFPTYEHQKIEAIRAPYRDRFVTQSVPVVNDSMLLPGWAAITHQFPLQGDGVVEALRPFHIWTDDWLTERLAWKPERPAFVLLLRAYRFAEPIPLTYRKTYAGCRSWITLDEVEPLPDSTPVLATAAYEQQVAAIKQAITPVTA